MYYSKFSGKYINFLLIIMLWIIKKNFLYFVFGVNVTLLHIYKHIPVEIWFL